MHEHRHNKKFALFLFVSFLPSFLLHLTLHESDNPNLLQACSNQDCRDLFLLLFFLILARVIIT